MGAGCHPEQTAIRVRVSTDFEVRPMSMPTVQLLHARVVSAASDGPQDHVFDVRGGQLTHRLPLEFFIVPAGSGSDAVSVDIDGFAVFDMMPTGTPEFHVHRNVHFVPGQVSVLDIVLHGACEGMACPDTQVCDEHRVCQPEPTGDLPHYDPDAGPPDSGLFRGDAGSDGGEMNDASDASVMESGRPDDVPTAMDASDVPVMDEPDVLVMDEPDAEIPDVPDVTTVDATDVTDVTDVTVLPDVQTPDVVDVPVVPDVQIRDVVDAGCSRPTTTIPASGADSLRHNVVVASGQSDFLVVWIDGSSRQDLYGWAVRTDGTFLGGAPLRISSGSGSVQDGSVRISTLGTSYVVTWRENSVSGSASGEFARTVSWNPTTTAGNLCHVLNSESWLSPRMATNNMVPGGVGGPLYFACYDTGGSVSCTTLGGPADCSQPLAPMMAAMGGAFTQTVSNAIILNVVFSPSAPAPEFEGLVQDTSTREIKYFTRAVGAPGADAGPAAGSGATGTGFFLPADASNVATLWTDGGSQSNWSIAYVTSDNVLHFKVLQPPIAESTVTLTGSQTVAMGASPGLPLALGYSNASNEYRIAWVDASQQISTATVNRGSGVMTLHPAESNAPAGPVGVWFSPIALTTGASDELALGFITAASPYSPTARFFDSASTCP